MEVNPFTGGNYTKHTPVTPFTGAVENSGMGLFFERVEDTTLAIVTIVFTDKDLAEKMLSLRKSKGVVDSIAAGKFKLMTHIFVSNDPDNKVINSVAYQIKLADFTSSEEDPDTLLDISAILPVSVLKTWIREICEKDINEVVVAMTAVLSNDVSDNRSSFAVYELGKDTRNGYRETLEGLDAAENGDEAFGEVEYPDKPMYLRAFVPKELKDALKKGFKHGTA